MATPQGTLCAIGLQICLLIGQTLMLDASITAAQSRLNNRSHPGNATPTSGQPQRQGQPLGHILDATFGAATVEIIWAGASAAMRQPSPQYRIQNRVAAGINILRLIPLRPPIRLLPANPHLGQLPCHPEPVKSPDERHPDC